MTTEKNDSICIPEGQADTTSALRHVGEDEVRQAITGGIVFRGSKLKGPVKAAGVKTKAKKKGYVTGAHGSGAAKKKADIRTRRANRHKNG